MAPLGITGYALQYGLEREMSKLWMKISTIYVPPNMRYIIYSLWSSIIGCPLPRDYYNYPSLQMLFIRNISPSSRVIGSSPLISPVDGRIISKGILNNHMGQEKIIKNIKNIDYNIIEFLNQEPELQDPINNELYNIVFYLSPCNIHRFYSPADWSINTCTHIGNTSMPIISSRVIDGMFNYNERVVLAGNWKHGFFSMIAVGAANVGSIIINLPGIPNFSNDYNDNQTDPIQIYQYQQPINRRRGDELGLFKFGSCVVLIFEKPKNSNSLL